ncbi:MAG: 50S ribosomal protein L15, partial [Candidatus Methylomirabilis sp.]|nr:50S ribosomal protein L15 [Deltaproteobacteria bacterium]
GAKRARKRVGRGPGSGLGKTSGKGHKGQKARTHPGLRPRFEGGQTPLQRRLPKRGFRNEFKKAYVLVQVERLAAFGAGETVDVASLREKGLVSGPAKDGVKILGVGALSAKLTVKVEKVTKGARAAIEGAGGVVELVPERAPGPNRPKFTKKGESQAAAT